VVGGDLPGGAGLDQVPEQLAALLVGERRGVVAVELEQVEDEIGDRHGGRPANRLGAVVDVHALLHAGEAGVALGVERHDLAVEDRLVPVQHLGQAGQLGEPLGDLDAVGAAHLHRAVGVDAGHDPHAVPLDLEGPAVLVLAGERAGRRLHRLGQGDHAATIRGSS
jgi:hypothetical protein